MEKEKGKINPFIEHLRPTEEILWLFLKARPTLLSRIAAPGLFMVGFVGLFIYGATDGLPDIERIKAVSLAIGLIVLIGTFVFIPMGIYALFKRGRSSNHLPEQAYAVTSERLLYRDKKNVTTIALEDLPPVSLFLGGGGKGTLSFGAMFPIWPDVDDAIRIKQLIDDAQKKQMQRIAG